MSKISKSAWGEECMVRIPGVCNFTPETTVLAHLGGGGMGRKKPDYHAAYTCSSCHDALDGRVQTPYTRDELELMHRQGVERTQDKLMEKGLMKSC